MKFKLRTKLLMGFIVVSLIGAGVGIFGIASLSQGRANIEHSYSFDTLPIAYLVHMKANFVEERLYATKAILGDSREVVEQYRTQFNKLVTENNDWENQYQSKIYSAADKKLYDAYDASGTGYEKAAMAVFDASASGDKVKALAMMTDNSDNGLVATAGKHQADLDKLVEVNEKAAGENAAAIGTESTLAITVMTAAAVIGFGVSIFFAIWIGVWMISRPLNQVQSTLQGGAVQIAAASTQLSSSAQEIANGASEQAAAIEETSASMEELSSMVKQNLANSQEASQLAQKASKASQDGYTDMTRMVDSMRDIARSSEQISKVVKLIEDISFQTNILALNAAVEAARAGEAGLGFAVVADEVKNLANKSAEAAKESTGMIEDAIRKIEEGASTADRLSTTFKDILASVQKVAEMSKEVEVASAQQDTGINQVTKAVMQFDEVVQANASTSEEAASSAEELSSQAAAMMQIVDRLSIIVQGRASSNAAGPQARSMPVHKNNGAHPMVTHDAGLSHHVAPHISRGASRERATVEAHEVSKSSGRGENLIPFEDDEELTTL